MEISLFTKCIKALIVENDRVDIPHLGSFVAELMPAAFNSDRSAINPPYRKVSFHKREVSLAEGQPFLQVLAREAGLTSEKAILELDGLLSSLRAELDKDSSTLCDIKGICPELTGLEPVKLKQKPGWFKKVIAG